MNTTQTLEQMKQLRLQGMYLAYCSQLELPMDQQLEQLRGGLWYVNIHSTAHPGGEIRGQLDIPGLSGAVVTNCFERGCHLRLKIFKSK